MIISGFDRVENLVGKGENAGYQHFLLFPQCFENAPFPSMSKGVIVWEWVNGVYMTCDRQHCNDDICGFPHVNSTFSTTDHPIISLFVVLNTNNESLRKAGAKCQ